MMPAPEMVSPVPRAHAEHRADSTALAGSSDSTTPAQQPDFGVIYVANRYRLPMHVATLVTRLANIGREL
jgi:hypothetical protein